MKDKEWLKKEVRNAFSWGVNLEEGGMIRAVDMDYVIKLIDQLDEPEVLSEEWIDEHAQGGCDELVYIEDLENLLVPKQELPVVPVWFHKKVSYERSFIVKDTIDAWIINEIAITKLYADNPKEEEPSLFDKDEHDYIADNFRDLVRAVLDGYEVGELEE